MNSVVDSILVMAGKVGYYILQYGYISMNWLNKSFSIQFQAWRKCNAQKHLDRIFVSLGAEIFAYYKKGGDAGWRIEPTIEQQLRKAEEAEARVFQADAGIEAINAAYNSKKDEIISKYTLKRAEIRPRGPESDT